MRQKNLLTHYSMYQNSLKSLECTQKRRQQKTPSILINSIFFYDSKIFGCAPRMRQSFCWRNFGFQIFLQFFVPRHLSKLTQTEVIVFTHTHTFLQNFYYLFQAAHPCQHTIENSMRFQHTNRKEKEVNMMIYWFRFEF